MDGSISLTNHGPEMTIAALRSLKSDFTSAPEASCGIAPVSCRFFTKPSESSIGCVSKVALPDASKSCQPKPRRIAAW